jgi:hypothetical protein
MAHRPANLRALPHVSRTRQSLNIDLDRNIAGGEKRTTMKTLLCLLATLAGMSVIGTPAHAQNYPWCAYYGKDSGTNCGFTTFEQCLANVSGIGGFCEPNTLYQPPTGARRYYRSYPY